MAVKAHNDSAAGFLPVTLLCRILRNERASLMVYFLRLSLVLTLLMAAALPAHSKRLALVMGNDNYTHVSKLEKAGNDADAMARELRNAGFSVQLQKNLNYRSMVKTVESFANSITGGDEVVIFFAGHGVQLRTGSYLLPTDIEATSESEIEKTAYALDDLTQKINDSKPAFTLMLVDACRNNPIKTKGRSVGGSRGLSAVEPPKGQMIVYSASKGQEALDRLSDNDGNPNSVFTREFIAKMRQPGIRIEDLMRDVQDAVESLAQTVSHEQRPAIYNEARGNFYFFGPTKVQVVNEKPAARDPDEEAWAMAQRLNIGKSYAAYLESFPKGKFISAARMALSALTEVREVREVPKQNNPPVPVIAKPPDSTIHQSAFHASGDYPTRPIRLVVPSPAGGSLDIVARLLAPKMSALLGQVVVIDNKAGAGGAVGMSAVAQQKPDGYTLGIAGSSTMTMMPAINNENSGFSPLQSFTPIAHIVAMPSVLVVHPSFAAKDFAGFMATIKQANGKYSYASAGVGSASHMLMELFAMHSNTNFVHIPYRGSAPAIVDIISGQVPIIFESLASVLPHIQAGKLIPLAVIAPRRLPQLPQVPTLIELGLAGANRMPFTGIVAPKGIPPNVASILSTAISEALKDPSIRNRLEEFSAVVLNGSGNQMAQQISDDLGAYQQLVKQRKLPQP